MLDLNLVFEALRLSARAHRDQRRKGTDASPYINHPIEVAHLLVSVGGVRDPEVLAAALLHDTIEDTVVGPEELEERFGPRVRGMVEEVTDDTSLHWKERKRLQVERASGLSEGARHVKLADKIANVLDVGDAPPADWSTERRHRYLDWTERVVEGVRGTNAALEAHYDACLLRARRALEG